MKYDIKLLSKCLIINTFFMQKKLKMLKKINKEDLVFVNGGSSTHLESKRNDSISHDSKKNDTFNFLKLEP